MNRSYSFRYHRDVLEHDLPWFHERLGPERFSTFQGNLEHAKQAILSSPHNVGSDCQYELKGWRYYKFFIGRQYTGKRPSGRIIFDVQDDRQRIVISAVWIRAKMLIEPDIKDIVDPNIDSPYFMAAQRQRKKTSE